MAWSRRDPHGRVAQQLARDYAVYLHGHDVRIRRDGITAGWCPELVDAGTGEWITVAGSAEPAQVQALVDRFDTVLAQRAHPAHTHRSVLLPHETDPVTTATVLDRGCSVVAWCAGNPVVRRSPAGLAAMAADDRLWTAYATAVVDLELPTRRIRVTPATDPDPAVTAPPCGPMHVLAACQPGERPGTDHERRAWRHLRTCLREHGARVYPAVGGSLDGGYHELSVAASGLTDDQARAWGRQFGQVAVFAWRDTAWALLATQPHGCSAGPIGSGPAHRTDKPYTPTVGSCSSR